MSLLVYCELVSAYFIWVGFLIMNWFYSQIRNIYWRFDGTYGQLLMNRQPGNYNACAHVMRRIFSHRLDDFIEARQSDFVLVHDRFEQPDYVLRDDVTLYTITETDAVFVQSQKGWKKPAFCYDFFIIGQYSSADKVITMPLNHFMTLADSLEDDGATILFLQNQARCGGTLLTGICKESGRCVTFNEPHCFNALVKHLFINYVWTGEMARKYLRNTIRLLCKPYRGLDETPLAYVIKPTVNSIVCADLIHDAMPNAVQVFLYREPVAIAISIRRIGQVLRTLKLMFYLPNLPRMIAPLLRLIGYCDVDFRGFTPRGSQELEFGYRLACLSMFHYITANKHGTNIHGMRYNDLVTHRSKMIRQFFQVCGLPERLVEKAERAMDRDSQASSPISRTILMKAIPNPPVATQEFLNIAQDMSAEFGVPSTTDFNDDSFHLPGSILP